MYISFFGLLSGFLSYFAGLFLHWLSIFAAPVKQPEMFWILIPVWFNWFFVEFFVEKHGTSFGNAIGNGVVPVLASIDWTRYLYRLLSEGAVSLTFGIFIKFIISAAVFSYGTFVIFSGINVRKIVFYIGRIRWITYILVMFTPIIYNVIRFDFRTMIAILLFFPLYWWAIELFDTIVPEPRVYQHS